MLLKRITSISTEGEKNDNHENDFERTELKTGRSNWKSYLRQTMCARFGTSPFCSNRFPDVFRFEFERSIEQHSNSGEGIGRQKQFLWFNFGGSIGRTQRLPRVISAVWALS